MDRSPPDRVLFAHTPKAAGVHLIEYFSRELGYARIQSQNQTQDGVWADLTIEELSALAGTDRAFLNTHVLAFGWADLVEIIPRASKDEIVTAIRTFREHGWLTFTFVRHPGDLLCSFYFYVLDAHQKGWDAAVAKHVPVVGRKLDDFLSEHCERELLPEYWREFDVAAEATDANFHEFFRRHFDHAYAPRTARSHASGSRGYAHYCATGEISSATQARIRGSRNMEIFNDILSNGMQRRDHAAEEH